MYYEYHITIDSFSELPSNWEDIASFLNELIDDHIDNNPNESDIDFKDFLSDLWENYWNGKIPNAPAAIESDE